MNRRMKGRACDWFSRTAICLAAIALSAAPSSAQNVNTPVPPGGSVNHVPVFSGSNTIVNSQIVDNGMTVSINTPSPAGLGDPPLLQVNNSPFGPAITATSTSYAAVTGTATNGYGVLGIEQAANGSGIFGWDQSGGHGIGVQAFSLAGIGLQSGANSNGWAATLDAPNGLGLVVGVQGKTPSFFFGNVDVIGTLFKSGGAFKIDHPLDPENKYLSHSFVESPDMMNIYNGNIQTDAKGTAMVTLPEWFEALNRDFRYQLTTIGQPAQAWVASKISGNRFIIKTDKPLVEVSWQVTGIRQDAWANAHRIAVDEEKPEAERGFYLHPELHGQSEEKGVMWGRYPEKTRALKERAQAVARQ